MKMNRRKWLRWNLTIGALFITDLTTEGTENSRVRLIPSRPVPDFEMEEATIEGLQDAMKSGRLKARTIAEAYLRRIEEIDRHGPSLASVIELNPDALEICESLDKERQLRGPRGPLHGIPLLLKDNIDTADKMMTTAGSLALEKSHPKRDAFLVRRLRDAGAVILGKTNLSEWANFRSGHSISGWSGRGGLTRNPYALDRNPCGSSSGSGVAISSNLGVVAVGTETDGSIVCPASANSIVGIKPTLGLVSRSGIIPIAQSQDTAGPMARTVRDAVILLEVLSGVDADDQATQAIRGRDAFDYSRFLDPKGLQGARLGVAREFCGFNEEVDRLIDNCVGTMKQLGATIIDPAKILTVGKFEESEMDVLQYEFKAGLNTYISRLCLEVKVRSLKDLIEFNEQNRDKEMPYFGQDLFQKAQAKGDLSSQQYRKSLKKNHRLSRVEGIDAVMQKHRLDALIAPTGGPPWLTDLVNGDHSTGGCSAPAAVAGYPHITVPAGYVHGLPVGISFFGKAFSEAALIRLAYAFEQATKLRRPPKFLPTAAFGARA
ncbi:MAG TPA: amidase [Terriglobia bacterium]|nr:amidase [Terriglobia bacterium]